MSNKEYLIRQALEAHLLTMPGVLPTVWQRSKPPDGLNENQPYQKVYLLRDAPEVRGLQERSSRHQGYLQINLVYPATDGAGPRPVELYAGKIVDHFKAGTVLTASGVKVRIRGRAAIGDPTATAPYVVPVSIRFESFLSN